MTDKLTPEQVAEIEARCEAWSKGMPFESQLIAIDIPALLADRASLVSELRRLSKKFTGPAPVTRSF